MRTLGRSPAGRYTPRPTRYGDPAAADGDGTAARSSTRECSAKQPGWISTCGCDCCGAQVRRLVRRERKRYASWNYCAEVGAPNSAVLVRASPPMLARAATARSSCTQPYADFRNGSPRSVNVGVRSGA